MFCIAEKSTGGRKRKRKLNETKTESSVAIDDRHLSKKSRKMDQGRSTKVSKTAKARKSQFERRNIR